MFATLTVLATLISGMFVASIITTIAALRRERQELDAMLDRRELF